jgi:Sigma-70, region 4
MGRQTEMFLQLAKNVKDHVDDKRREAGLDGGPSREQLRSRRKHPVRASTISTKRMPKYELELGRILFPEDEHADVARPKTRADCMDQRRPCPWVSCAHHLYLDVSAQTGAIKLNFPDLEPDELPETCALDVADRADTTLERVGALMNVTRERIRQIEIQALAKVHARRVDFEQTATACAPAGGLRRRRDRFASRL